MAGIESESSIVDPCIIDPQSKINYGKNYDGVCKESVYRNGLFYTKKEIVLLGGGDEKTGLQMIGDSILVEMDLDEEIDPLRPYNEDIEDLTNDYWIH